MKIQTQNTNNISDTLSLSGKILTINGKDYDLDNLPVIPVAPEGEEIDNTAFFAENQCYIDAEGNNLVSIKVDNQHFFLFVNNNYLLFHDKDLNGEIDMQELGELIDCYNLPEAKRRAEHKKYRDSFSAEDWKERMEACNPKR